MRTIEAESQVLRDLREESALVTARSHPDFTVWAIRHPTLGKLVIVEGRDGSGIVVETEEEPRIGDGYNANLTATSLAVAVPAPP